MKRLWLSLLCCGALLAFAFGSLSLVFELHRSATARLGRDLRENGRRVFVTLDRSQKKETPGGGVSFFYSYSGRHRGRKIAASEHVDASLFHLHSEGKNVEAMVYVDPANTMHVHLRDNDAPFGRRFAFLQSLATSIALVAFLWACVGGLLFRRARSQP